MRENIKTILQDDGFYLSLLLVTIAITAFGLGRLAERAQSASDSNPEVAAVTFSDPVTTNESETVVASKNGTKYHLPWCAGASQMNEENKIVFESRAAAEAAGYTPAANCKGL